MALGSSNAFLTRLAGDTAGTTLAIMGAALFPLAGLVGGGVDMSRLYLSKTRLQQACDAGALAGRKVMGGGTWAFNNNAANRAAENFFDSNFQQGAYGTTTRTRAFAENAGRVTGTATVIVPMTIMRIFGNRQQTLRATCDAEMRLPNTDVMFVLDTTGSMSSDADGNQVNSGPTSKIVAMRRAVNCFYEIVARLNTAEVCTGGDPTGGTGTQVQVRFGFVPYASNVNVGRLLDPAWMANSWTYQSRQEGRMHGVQTGAPVDGPYSSYSAYTVTATFSGLTDAQCAAKRPTNFLYTENGPYNQGYAETTNNFKADQPQRETFFETGNLGNPRICYVAFRTRDRTRTFTFNKSSSTASGAVAFKAWRYRAVSLDVSGLKNGSTWNNEVSLPIGDDFTNRAVAWNGCIEERATVRATNYNPIPADAKDLDIDLAPQQSDASTLWGPALFDAVYARRSTFNNTSARSTAEITTFTNFSGEKINQCPEAARRLQTWPTAAPFENYVNSLEAGGNTYHDIGLIWGARLLSPTGLFRADNALTPQGAEIERHLIFMTDGDAFGEVNNYAAYGHAWYDRRQTDAASEPSQQQVIDQINARFPAMCNAVKNQNITLWVISFGNGTNAATEARLSGCATPGRYFQAADGNALQATFRSIANQISQLRLTS